MSISILVNKFKKNDFGITLLHFKNYFSADIATKALAFISIPVLTRLLTTEDYGIVNVYGSYIKVFLIIFSLNSFASISRYYYENRDDYKTFVGTSIILSLATILPFFIIFSLYKDLIIEKLDMPNGLYYFIFPSILFLILESIFRQNFVPLKESKKIARVSVIKAYLGFVVTVVILLILNKSLYLGPIISSIILGFFFSIYYIIQLIPYIKLSLLTKHVKYILGYSVPLIPEALGGIILAQIDRLMINHYDGNSDAGLYSFAYNIGMLLLIFTEALFQSWTPDLFKYMNESNFKKRDTDIGKMFRLIMLAALFLIYYGQEIAMLLAAKSFHSSSRVIPIVVFGYIFFAVFRVYGIYPAYVRKTYYLSIILLVPSLINIYLNYLFIPKYGYIAAAYTTVVSYFLMAVLSWIISKHFLKINIPSVRLLLFPLLAICVFIMIYYFLFTLNTNFWYLFIYKAILLSIFAVLLFYKQLKGISRIINQ